MVVYDDAIIILVMLHCETGKHVLDLSTLTDEAKSLRASRVKTLN